MHRFLISVSSEQNKYLERVKNETDESKSGIIRNLIQEAIGRDRK